MLRKISMLLLLATSLIFANADRYDYNASENNGFEYVSKPQPQEPAESEDHKISFAVHPLSLMIYRVVGLTMLYGSLEIGFGNRFSLITRPTYIDGTMKKVTMSGFGITEGFRVYMGHRGHRGWYLEPEVQYVSIDGHNSRASATASGVGIYFLSGYKLMVSHFVFGADGGIGFNFISGSSNDVDFEVSKNGFGFDMNIYVGAAF